MRMAVCGLVLILSSNSTAQTAADTTVVRESRDAYEQAFPALPEQERPRFLNGQGVFSRSWVVAPSLDTAFDGLGPLHSRLACVSCHPRNGRGLAPERPTQRLRSMLLRLSVPGQDAHGGPLPHPVYGDQLNEEAIPGVPPEGRASLQWEESEFRLQDGTRIALRRPRISLSALAYGPADALQISPRAGPMVAGLGLLEAVPEATLQALINADKPDGVRGRLNRVYDPMSGEMRTGRFGYKATAASLYAQSVKAMQGDLGISSAVYPEQNCSPAQRACREAVSGGSPEISDEQLQALDFYLQHLAVPPRRDTESPQVREGERLFAQIGCAVCHRSTLPLSADFPYAQEIAPYTDLLLHDLGEGLADGGSEYLAGPADWRTSPLWGLGLSAAIAGDTQYLHDGRARSLNEAIVWHEGEARTARDRFAALTAQERDALIAFLHSL